MSFLGMGTLEILVIALIAFIFLGPERLVNVARMLGKLTGEIRRMTRDLPDLIVDEAELKRNERPIVHRGGGPTTTSSQSKKSSPEPQQSDIPPDNEGGPVAFRPGASPDRTTNQSNEANNDEAQARPE